MGLAVDRRDGFYNIPMSRVDPDFAEQTAWFRQRNRVPMA
jgi:hypothetical protein